MRRLPLVLAAVALGACPKSAAELDLHPVLEPLDCPDEAESVAPGTTCFHLVVPESRGQRRSRTVRIGVARLPPVGVPDETLPPAVFLQGGPGQPILHDLVYAERALAPIRRERALWLMDHRGLGGSRPSLGCRVEDLYAEADRAGPIAYPDYVARCAAHQVKDGADLSAYRSATLAADVDALRRAIGAEQVDLVGGSYGSRLAMTVLRDFPDAVRSVVLDAPAPPAADLYAELPAAVDDQLERFVVDCEADPVCLEILPEPRATLDATREKLDSEPRSLSVFVRGVPRDLRLDGKALIQYLHGMLNQAALIPAVPAVLAGVAEGNFGALALAVQANAARNENVSPVMHLAVQCSEELPFNDDAVARQIEADHPRTAVLSAIAEGRRSCELVSVPAADPIEDAAVSSEVPVFLMVGAYDGKSRPVWSETAVESLPNGVIQRFPAVGHGALHTECGGEAAASFLRSPSAWQPPACLSELRPPRFVKEPGPVILEWTRLRDR